MPITINTFSSFKQKESLSDSFYSVNDAPDFHDPFSELNLFLSREIKQFMRSSGNSKKWSLKIQEELIQKIAPAFEKNFPHLRLSVTALKKSWERIALLLSQIQNEKEALTQEGKLNLPLFIRKNIQHFPPLSPCLHPSVYSHQLAVKIGEYIASIDGVKPKLDHLTKTIWSLQRHLLPNFDLFQHKSPYDAYDKIDKLIIKLMLEMTAKECEISQPELELKVKESLQSLQALPSFACVDTMTANIAALLAEKLYPNLSLHTSFLEEEKNAILRFLHRQVSLCQNTSHALQHTDLIRRILALYTLASQLPKDFSPEEIDAAVRSVYPNGEGQKPPFAQSLYAFISAELLLSRTEEYCHSVSHACQVIQTTYQEAKNLPKLEGKESEFLEIAIWKTISESESLLKKLPYCIGHRIEEEIANVLIDDPELTFNGAIQKTVKFFQQIKELTSLKKGAEIEQKVHQLTLQHDMIYRTIRLDADRPLVNLIKEKAKHWTHRELVCEVTHAYLRKHPELLNYTPQLQTRITSIAKYLWYTETHKEESSFERFIKWHQAHLLSQTPHLKTDRLSALLEERCKKMIPLMPFVPARSMTEQEESQKNKGNAQELSHC